MAKNGPQGQDVMSFCMRQRGRMPQGGPSTFAKATSTHVQFADDSCEEAMCGATVCKGKSASVG